MSALDVIALPGQPTFFARRVAVEAWQAAGSPTVYSAGRLYSDQKYLYDGWRKRLPGFNPADNPDDESQRLAHVRFVAFDISPTADRVRRLTAAGLVRPYWYELWHWELPNVRKYGIVRSIPSTAADGVTPIPPVPEKVEHDMSVAIFRSIRQGVGEFLVYASPAQVACSRELSTISAADRDFEFRVAKGVAKAAGLGDDYDIPTIDDSPNGGWFLRNQVAGRIAAMPADWALTPANPFIPLVHYARGGGDWVGPSVAEIRAALVPDFAAVNANIDDQPTSFKITPEE